MHIIPRGSCCCHFGIKQFMSQIGKQLSLPTLFSHPVHDPASCGVARLCRPCAVTAMSPSFPRSGVPSAVGVNSPHGCVPLGWVPSRGDVSNPEDQERLPGHENPMLILGFVLCTCSHVFYFRTLWTDLLHSKASCIGTA